jgi:hypothetical protein
MDLYGNLKKFYDGVLDFFYINTCKMTTIAVILVAGLKIDAYNKKLWILVVGVLLHATPARTWDLGLYCLTQSASTHIPQWDSNRQHKDLYLWFAALTIAPRR